MSEQQNAGIDNIVAYMTKRNKDKSKEPVHLVLNVDINGVWTATVTPKLHVAIMSRRGADPVEALTKLDDGMAGWAS